MGVAPTLSGFIAAFLGGIGSLWGAALGGLVLGLLSSWSALWLQVDYGPVVVFGAMFLILLIRPQGLLGRAAA
jgi:branched-chain amino acid transport system permease protein